MNRVLFSEGSSVMASLSFVGDELEESENVSDVMSPTRSTPHRVSVAHNHTEKKEWSCHTKVLLYVSKIKVTRSFWVASRRSQLNQFLGPWPQTIGNIDFILSCNQYIFNLLSVGWNIETTLCSWCVFVSEFVIVRDYCIDTFLFVLGIWPWYNCADPVRFSLLV